MRPCEHEHAYINAEARLHLPGYLDDLEADRLREIPGIQVWRKAPMIRCAYSALPAIMPLVKRAVIASGLDWSEVLVEHSCAGAWTAPIPAEVVPRGLWYGGDLEANPTGITLTDYQKESIKALIRTGGGLLEIPAGGGKTLVADIAAIATAAKRHDGDLSKVRILTVCKASAREQQRREKVRFFDVEPFALLPKSKRQKSDRWQTWDDYMADDVPHGLRWLIVGWDAIRPLEEWLAGLQFAAVILDEAKHAKSSNRVKFSVYVDEDADGGVSFERDDKSNRSAATARLVSTIPHRFLTEATPLTNRLIDWWGIGNLIERPACGGFDFDAWGPTPSKFLIRYCNGAPGDFGGIVTVKPHYSNIEEFKARIQHTRIVVPHRVVTAQLPPCKRRVHKVLRADQDKPLSLSRADRAAYNAALKEAREDQRAAGKKLGDAGSTERLEASKARLTTLRLQDACNRKRTPTTDVVMEYVDSAVGRRPGERDGESPGAFDRSLPRGKVLVFYGLTRALEDVARKIRRKVDRVWIAQGAGCVQVGRKADGSEDVPVDVEEMKSAYMGSAEPAVIVGTYQYLGESHNLQDSDAIVVGMLPYTPAMVAQIIGRGARLGQARPLDVVFMQAEGTADDRLIELVVDKLPAVEALGEGAHGLDGLSRTLRGLDDVEGLLSSFADDLLAAL